MSLSALLMTVGLWMGGILSAATPHARPDALLRTYAGSRDSLTVRQVAEDSTRAFLLAWRLAWFDDFNALKSNDYAVEQLRTAHAHCHARMVPLDEYAAMISKNYEVLQGRISAAGLCPSWELGNKPSLSDEADSIDAALTPAHRSGIRSARAHLLDLLSAAHDSIPGDSWIIGQQVRFLMDQGMSAIALDHARACRADMWWCSALAGFVLHKRGAYASADSAFAVAGAALTAEQRCEWNDIRTLLPDSISRAYTGSHCDARAQITERYWWLADPLFSERGNERRSENFARRVMVLLHSALDDDERYHWRPGFAGDAVQAMMMRYGWPTAAFWMGATEDVSHDKYLRELRAVSAAPYSSAEYSVSRVHFGAAWSAVADPFHADATAWELNSPSNMRTTRKGNGKFWWPQEHMRVEAASVLQFPAGQTAFFRRQHDTQVAVAIDIDGKNAAIANVLSSEQASAILIVSPAPDSFAVVQRAPSRERNKVALSGFIPAHPALLAVEAQSTGQHTGVVRTRFGITPPPPLDSLNQGTIAISDPVFFLPAANDDLPQSVDSMLPHMLGSSTIARGGRVGIFWENYGVSRNDSVRFSVNAISMSGRSFMQRLASALRIASVGAVNVGVSWVDPRPDYRGAVSGTAVTITPRSVVLDLAALPRGTYKIEVQAMVNGREPARAGRTLMIQ